MNLSWKPLVLILLLAIALSVVLGVRQSRIKASQAGVVPGSLEALAQTVLSEGGNSAQVPLKIFEYGSAEGITQVLSKYSVVIAHPVSSNSYVWDSENQVIGTWHKFVVTESLSLKPFPTCETCAVSPDPPAGMTGGSGELLISRFGGVVSVNGVTLTSSDPNFPNYQSSQNYLLFLNIDQSKKVGVLAAGPIGVFSVSSNGVLTPVTQIPNALAEDIAQTYGNSLPALRAALSGSAPTPTPTPTPCSVAHQVISACTNNGGFWDIETCTCN